MTTNKTPKVTHRQRVRMKAHTRSYLMPVLMMTVGAVLFVYGVTHGGCRP